MRNNKLKAYNRIIIAICSLWLPNDILEETLVQYEPGFFKPNKVLNMGSSLMHTCIFGSVLLCCPKWHR